MMRLRTLAFRFLFAFAFLVGGFAPLYAVAQTAALLQSQIDDHAAHIAQLQSDIAQYQKQLDALGAQKNTLQSAIHALSLEQKQLAAELSITKNKIDSANLEIRKLSLSIGDKEERIATDGNGVKQALRDLAESGEHGVVEQFFGATSFADAWTAEAQAAQFNRALSARIKDLADAKRQLSDNRDAVSKTKEQLVGLQRQLTAQKRSIDANKAAEQSLLAQTKNKEANYQALIAEKQSAEKQFEQELLDLQSRLNLIVHPDSLPKTGSGVLSWPFSASFMANCLTRASVFGNAFCVTQYFGNTDFATRNSQIYNGHGHDGIDLGAPIGTPVLAARSGTVLGVGNTDLARDAKGNRCYSFGKWVMVEHGNGLSTLYAHLSEIDVSKGQDVRAGDEVGLSGMTGYATGPHLHFGVYATEGTKIADLGQWRGALGTPCTDGHAIIPVATLDAYLNPLSYL